MSSLAGIDLCLFPAAIPPSGVTSNFTDPPTYAPAVLAVSIVMMALSIIFTSGRLFANRKQLLWSDCKQIASSFTREPGLAFGRLLSADLNVVALVLSLGQGGLLLARMLRPACMSPQIYVYITAQADDATRTQICAPPVGHPSLLAHCRKLSKGTICFSSLVRCFHTIHADF